MEHYQVIGSLVISGIVGGVIGSILTSLSVWLNAASKAKWRYGTTKFSNIECTSLRVVDEDDGKTKIVLSDRASDFSDYLFEPANGKSEAKVFISTAEHGGRINVTGKDGSVSLGIGEHGGRVIVYGKNGETWLGINEHGGRVDVHGRNGVSGEAWLGIDDHGYGTVNTWDAIIEMRRAIGGYYGSK